MFGGGGGTLHNAGTVELGGAEVHGGFVNDAGATLRQTGTTPTSGTVTNSGLWDITGGGGLLHTGNNSFVNSPTGTLRKSAGPAIIATSVELNNAGLVESTAGELLMQSNAMLSGATLNGNRWRASGTGQLRFGAVLSLATNAATIEIAGPDASIPQLSTLSTNNGTLTLEQRAQLDVSGNLTNGGTLNLRGRSTLATAGTFTQTAAGTLRTTIDGRPSTGRFGRLVAAGAATLGGTWDVVRGPEFSAVADDVYTPIEFASHSGDFTTTTGLQISPSVGFSPLLGDEDYKLRVGPIGSTRTDLRARDVAITPAGTLQPGQEVEIAWTVENHGDPTLAGAWTDSVYLSRDAGFDDTDVLIGRLLHPGNVATGGEYSALLEAALPGVPPGSYRAIVVPDSRGDNASLPGSDGNAASPPRAVDIPLLVPGTPATGSIAAGERRYFRAALPAGQDLVLTGALGSGGKASVFARLDALPDDSDFDDRAEGIAAPDLFVGGDDDAHTAYVLLEGLPGAGAGQGFSLSAALVGFGIRSVTPNHAGNTGSVDAHSARLGLHRRHHRLGQLRRDDAWHPRQDALAPPAARRRST